jgi:glycosyltransferase involved in cell wall biosynthesis
MIPAAVILTRNEAPNIGRTLSQLSWLAEVVVVDSGSTDDTVAIASQFPNVRVVTRPFTTHAAQWNFGLHHTGLTAEWVLALDADFVVPDGLAAEIQTLPGDSAASGYWASFDYCIGGQRLRGAAYPPVTVLFRRERATYRQDGHTQRVAVDGPVQPLLGRIQHDDRKPLAEWLRAQSRYMELEVDKLAATPVSQLGWIDRARLALVVMPPAMFLYCYVVRGGVLDGRAGLYYALQRAAAELILSLHLVERRR